MDGDTKMVRQRPMGGYFFSKFTALHLLGEKHFNHCWRALRHAQSEQTFMPGCEYFAFPALISEGTIDLAASFSIAVLGC
jgi:hypothetical protein